MRVPFLLLALVVALLAATVPASAHGRVCVEPDGANLDRGGHGRPGPTGATGHCEHDDLLEFVVGWREEPPFAGVKNGLDLAVQVPAPEAAGGPTGDPAGGERAPTPIGAGNLSLRAQYEFGGRTFPVELRPQFDRPGWYTDDIAPTRAGAYTLRVWGTVNTTAGALAINWTHQPADVQPLRDIEFPEPSPDTAALQQRVAALDAEVQALRAQGSGAGKASPAADAGFLAVLLAASALGLAARRRR